MSTATVITTNPCSHCPFRQDVPIFLRATRRTEIARTLLRGGEFYCHSTVDYDEDDDGEDIYDTSESKFCVGAAKSLLVAGTDNQMLRIMERLGLVDLDAVLHSSVDVWDIHTWQTLLEGSTVDDRSDEEEVATCVNSDPNCLAPAGWLEGGVVVYGTEPADGECACCSEPLCSECADNEGRCALCMEEDQ